MKILFIHQNFPAQFKHLAPALVSAGHQVRALTPRQIDRPVWQGVELHRYEIRRASTAGIHPWLGDFESKTIRAEAAQTAMRAMQREGYVPDLVIAHPGWGEALLVKTVWPSTRLGAYCEYYYHAQGYDYNFDPEFSRVEDDASGRIRMKNLHWDLQLESVDAAICPTHWQTSTFPSAWQTKMQVIHDGIDTDLLVPHPHVSFEIKPGFSLSRDDEVITFVNRNCEPYRGYHIFMRALPELLRLRPRAQVLIVGGDGVSYGAPAPQGQNWRQIFADEVAPQMSEAMRERIHFVGKIDYDKFVQLLQVSRLHIYLTYPFVLSWSLLEAMSVGCTILASDTAPLREAIDDGENGILSPFFEQQELVKKACALLDDADERARLGRNARAKAITHYDLQQRCLPDLLKWVEQLSQGKVT